MTAPSSNVDKRAVSRVFIICALSVFIVSLVLYTLTLAPTVTLVDSGELIVAARTLGVAHPPGFPLYVLLAHLASAVPIGNVALRVNFASAIFAALASSMATLVVLEVIANSRSISQVATAAKKQGRAGRSNKQVPDAQLKYSTSVQGAAPLVVCCLTSGLGLAFSRTLWNYATIAEVYTLNTLLILIIFLLMFVWRRRISQRRSGIRPADEPTRVGALDKPLYAAAFVFGLALGVHHVTVALMLPALAVLVLATEGRKFFFTRRLVYAAIISIAGFLFVYAYLPIAASRSPIVNWGDPRTFERFLWHITGKQYQGFFSSSLGSMATQLGEFIKLAAREFGPSWLPVFPALAIGGLMRLFRRDRPMFWFLVFVIAADLIFAASYDIAEDKDAYYLPTFVAVAIASGFGAEWFIEKVRATRLAQPAAQYGAYALLLIFPLSALVANLPYDNRSRYFIAADYVENILSTIEPGGMLLTRDWQVYSPMLYAQEVEHRRNDTIIVDVNQLRRSWYYDYLKRTYPSVIEQAGDKVEAFLEDLRHWERDPDLYQRDLTLNHRIDSRFYEMIVAFVTNHIRSGPVYITLDIASNREGADAKLTESLAASYQFVPQGLVFKLATDLAFRPDPPLLTRGLADGTIKFEADDVVNLKVLPVYVTMFYNRGRYLAVTGRHEEAIEYFKQSLALRPGFSLAQQGINESQNAILRGPVGKTQ